MAKRIKKLGRISKKSGTPDAESLSYRTEIVENVPPERVEPEVAARRANPDYVRHSIEAEPDGEFTLFFIFRK